MKATTTFEQPGGGDGADDDVDPPPLVDDGRRSNSCPCRERPLPRSMKKATWRLQRGSVHRVLPPPGVRGSTYSSSPLWWWSSWVRRRRHGGRTPPCPTGPRGRAKSRKSQKRISSFFLPVVVVRWRALERKRLSTVARNAKNEGQVDKMNLHGDFL